MAAYDAELLAAAGQLIERPKGLRGPLPSARVRRSISTSYYALFHFILDETALRVVGTKSRLRRLRRILARTISHAGALGALNKLKNATVDPAVQDFMRPIGVDDLYPTPRFARSLANAFADAQAKRHDADYDLNKPLTASDARLLRARIIKVIADWRAAQSPAERIFKHALGILILLKGKLRIEP